MANTDAATGSTPLDAFKRYVDEELTLLWAEVKRLKHEMNRPDVDELGSRADEAAE